MPPDPWEGLGELQGGRDSIVGLSSRCHPTGPIGLPLRFTCPPLGKSVQSYVQLQGLRGGVRIQNALPILSPRPESPPIPPFSQPGMAPSPEMFPWDSELSTTAGKPSQPRSGRKESGHRLLSAWLCILFAIKQFWSNFALGVPSTSCILNADEGLLKRCHCKTPLQLPCSGLLPSEGASSSMPRQFYSALFCQLSLLSLLRKDCKYYQCTVSGVLFSCLVCSKGTGMDGLGSVCCQRGVLT